MQGKMHNMGVILGGSFCQPETREARELAFRLYRYLTLCHVLLYKMHSSWLNHTTWADLVSLGLATHDEVKTLESVAYKTGWPWDTVTTWINMEVQRAAEAGQLSFIGAQKAVELSAEIRGSLTGFKGIFIINQPNQVRAISADRPIEQAPMACIQFCGPVSVFDALTQLASHWLLRCIAHSGKR